MEDHSWVQCVLVDLETYAAKNGLNKLECMLGQTRLAAKLEIAAGEFQEHSEKNVRSVLRLY